MLPHSHAASASLIPEFLPRVTPTKPEQCYNYPFRNHIAIDPMPSPEDQARSLEQLHTRAGSIYLKQRLGIERDKEALVFRQGLNFFHIENWYSIHGLIRTALRVCMMREKGKANTTRFNIVRRDVYLPQLPAAFDGFTLLHLSDLHLDMSETLTPALTEAVTGLDYDACVMTGDYRARTYGSHLPAIKAMQTLRAALGETIYAILGNHDSIHMVPALEEMGIRTLLNEHVRIDKDGSSIYIAGIDDPHYYRVDNLEKACEGIADTDTSILLAHTPEVYRQATHCGVDLYLCGHTHGGQICLPGGVPLMINAKAPRRFCRGAWQYLAMQGYTSVGCGVSVVDARFNCPPEITLHTLRASA